MLIDRADLQKMLKYEGTAFRQVIASDQDLICALENAGELPTQDLDHLYAEFAIFINPLWPYRHKPADPMTWTTVNGKDLIGNKPVLFWHLQNDFSNYLARFALVSHYSRLKKYLPVRLNLPFLELSPSAENFAFKALNDIALKQIFATLKSSGDINSLGPLQFFSRSRVSNWFVEEHQGRELFSKSYWWEDNVFT